MYSNLFEEWVTCLGLSTAPDDEVSDNGRQ